MSKHDLQARPIYHHKRESIEAHLTIVFAALAVSRWIEDTTGWSIKKFVRTARRYRTIEIQAGTHTLTAADPLPDDLRQALTQPSRTAPEVRTNLIKVRSCNADEPPATPPPNRSGPSNAGSRTSSTGRSSRTLDTGASGRNPCEPPLKGVRWRQPVPRHLQRHTKVQTED